MSAYLTTNTTEIERAAWYCSSLGYAYCTGCKHTQEIVARRLTSVPGRGDRCDGCGYLLTGSIEVCAVTYAVEATVCRIF